MQFNSCKPTAPDPLLASSKRGKIIEYSQMSIKILCTEVSKSMNKMNHDAYGSKFKMKVKYGSYIMCGVYCAVGKWGERLAYARGSTFGARHHNSSSSYIRDTPDR